PFCLKTCFHPVRSWGNQSFRTHLYNMTVSHGRLRIPHYQLVQCVYKKTSYARPIQLLKGVGTKCWAPDTEYLHAGDEIFVSVLSPTAVHTED
uniref:Uncharacterized protein n=1 Tax=Oncorhynchus tshawytscha TaxID=74940 RepID=A0A8C8ESG2_ONCTS